MIIIYFFPLLDWIGNWTVSSECIFTDGISVWLIVAYMSIVFSSCFWSLFVSCGVVDWSFSWFYLDDPVLFRLNGAGICRR